jgi:hypothetical protein
MNAPARLCSTTSGVGSQIQRLAVVTQSSTAIITSDALTITVTCLPSASPSSSAASLVIDATSRWPLQSRTTLAIASPRVTPWMVADSWFRALRRMDWLLR